MTDLINYYIALANYTCYALDIDNATATEYNIIKLIFVFVLMGMSCGVIFSLIPSLFKFVCSMFRGRV